MTNFRGFDRPTSHYFKMPNNLVNIMPNIKSLAELKVILYVMRHTWGYQEYDMEKKMALEEIANGRKGRNGERMDRGTGLSWRSVHSGVKRAVKDGYLIVRKDTSNKGRIKYYVKLRMRPENSSYAPKDSSYERSHKDMSGKESANSKETIERKKYIYTVFNHWNSKNILRHTNIEYFEPYITEALNHYTVDQITEAIDNYATILESPQYFYTFRSSLDKFLTNLGNIDTFLSENDPFSNFEDRW